MEEKFLHYIWQFQLFNLQQLKTTVGEKLEIIKVGIHNKDAGPDFFNGQIRLSKTRWAGNIEIHLKSSDWYKHKHQNDLAYDKVILHVVWENDVDVFRENGEPIPTFELKGKVKKSKLTQYQNLLKTNNWVPCEPQLEMVDKSIQHMQLDRMLIERLESKAKRISQILELNKNDWEACLYQLLCKYFGFKVNAVPFELLASSLPYQLLRKYQCNLFQMEAILFGQAGFLEEEMHGSYPISLKKEYEFVSKKHRLKPIDKHLWKFSRMRPSNFPTLRIAQLAQLLSQHSSLFQTIIGANTKKEVERPFNISASEYWNTHYRLDVPSANKQIKNLGKSSTLTLLINVVCPLLFTYGSKTDNQDIKDKAIQLLETLDSEQNAILKKWNKIGIKSDNAARGQALLQLKKEHCELKKCLTCMIGNALIKQA